MALTQKAAILYAMVSAVVVAFSALSLVLNLITPSAGERAIWAQVAAILLISSAIVAFSRPSASKG